MREREQRLNDSKSMDEEIENFLSLYMAETVEDEKIDETIEVLRRYMPNKKVKSSLRFLVRNEITYINKTYWIISLCIILFGMFIVDNYDISIYKTLLYISPIPIMLGMFEVSRGKREGVWELEKSLKYSYSKIVLSRIIIIMSFTSSINILLLIFSDYAQTSIMLIKLLTVCIMPVCLLSSLTLFLMIKISTSKSVMLISGSWFILIAKNEKNIVNIIEKTRDIALVIAIVISFIIFILSVFYFYKVEQGYEGEISWS